MSQPQDKTNQRGFGRGKRGRGGAKKGGPNKKGKKYDSTKWRPLT